MTSRSNYVRYAAYLVLTVALVALAIIRFTDLGADPSQTSEALPDAEPGWEELGEEDLIHPVPREVPDVPAGSLQDIAFEDVTEELGLSFDPGHYDPQSALEGMTSGVAMTYLGDVLTLLFTTPGGPVRFYQYVAGEFIDRTEDVGLADALPGTAAGFADLNADGSQDLVIGHQETAVVSVYRNNGDDTFSEATEAAGVDHEVVTEVETVVPATRGIAFADVNRDGHLDMVTTDWNPSIAWIVEQDDSDGPDVGACRSASAIREMPRTGTSQSRLWLGNGDGTFNDATKEWGLDLDPVFAFTPHFVDIDGDGWVDLLVTGDVCSSRIFRNDGGTGFVDVTLETDADMTPNGMGSIVRDFTGDGQPDWLVTGISYETETGECPFLTVIAGCTGNRLYLGNDDMSFTEATDEFGLRDSGWGWGMAAEDFANTGDLQVAVTNGFLAAGVDGITSQWSVYYDHFDDDPMSFFVRDGGEFTDVASLVGIEDEGVGHALLALDYDRDGRLDLLVNNADTGPRLYRNVTPAEDRHWVSVKLNDTTSRGNPDALGAKIAVTSSGQHTSTGWLASNDSYMTNRWPEFHAGLGADADPVIVDVWWPGETSPQRFVDIEVDQVVMLSR